MTHNTDLVTRLETLEKENRVMKIVGGGLLAGVLSMGLFSFVGPRVCETVWAERIVLQDSSGRSRMTLNAYNTTAPAITFQDKAGKAVAALKVTESGTMDVDLFKRGKTSQTSFRLTSEGFKNAASCSGKAKSDCSSGEASSIN